jgi:hypothetical protein
MGHNILLSKKAYRIAAIIVSAYILVLAFKLYISISYPRIDDTLHAELFYGYFELNRISSYATLICMFAMLYPFLVICTHIFYASPTASIIAFLGVFFCFTVEVCLLTVNAIQMQTEIPATLMITNGPNVMGNNLNTFYEFRELQRYLDFPVTFAKIAFSIIIVFSINIKPNINYIIKAAFGINACYFFVHFCCLLRRLQEYEDHNRTLSPSVELIIFGLILIWLVRAPFVSVFNSVIPER